MFEHKGLYIACAGASLASAAALALWSEVDTHTRKLREDFILLKQNVDSCNLQPSDDPDDPLGHSRREKIRELEEKIRVLTSRFDDEIGANGSGTHTIVQNIRTQLQVLQQHQDEMSIAIETMHQSLLVDVMRDHNRNLRLWLNQLEKALNERIVKIEDAYEEYRCELDALAKYFNIYKTVVAGDSGGGGGGLDTSASMHFLNHQVDSSKDQLPLTESEPVKGDSKAKATRQALVKKLMTPAAVSSASKGQAKHTSR
jgi:hypothetical protein